MSLIDQFKEEQWDAQPLVLGEFSVLAFDVVMPSGTVRCLVWASADGARLFHASAQDSFSEDVAYVVVKQCQAIVGSPSYDEVTIIASDFGSISKFEAVCVAPPSAGPYEHLSVAVRSKMFTALPSYRSEFREGMTANDFRHQVGRKDGWRVYQFRWDRAEKKEPSWG